MSKTDFDALFTPDRPVLFAFHAYPTSIHRLTYCRPEIRDWKWRVSP